MFGAIVNTIYYFRSRTLDISKVLLVLAAYVLGTFMERSIPKSGFAGRWLNPHPFNSKEHSAAAIIASSASQVALAVQVIAAQKLYYDNAPSTALSILIVISTQFLGYGFVGVLRRAVVYPSKMFWPVLLPVSSLLETLHKDATQTRYKRRVMYWTFAAVLLWQFLPEYIMPILTGFSIFCLANQSNTVFTTIFGGSNTNEGLGFLSLGLDWKFTTSQPLWLPLQTLTNNFIGYLICIALFAGVYYGNVWRAKDFPFMSHLLYSEKSTSSDFIPHRQNKTFDLQAMLEPGVAGGLHLPFFAGTFAASLLTNSLYITSTIVHLLLWNWTDIRKVWEFMYPQNLHKLITLTFWTSNPEVVEHNEVDHNPHYQFMRAYKECPNWWYAAVCTISVVIGLICIYTAETTLPWYGLFISILLAGLLSPFFGAQAALTGYQGSVQSLMHLLGGFIHPGNPTANLYFTLFGNASITQALSMTQNLKLGQYTKLPPRVTFTSQLVGTFIGSIISYAAMTAIVDDQRTILLNPHGSATATTTTTTTAVWSSAKISHLHTQATAFGLHGRSLFSLPSSRYAAIPLSLLLGLALPLPTFLLSRAFPSHRSAYSYLNTPLVAAYAGVLATLPSTSAVATYFALGFASQFWLRRYRPGWFVRYNYLVAAAVDAGAQACAVAVMGVFRGGLGSWAEVRMPAWWGNNVGGNFDRCASVEGMRVVRDVAGGGSL